MNFTKEELYQALRAISEFLVRPEGVHLHREIAKLDDAVCELIELRALATQLLPEKIHSMAYSLKQLESCLRAIYPKDTKE